MSLQSAIKIQPLAQNSNLVMNGQISTPARPKHPWWDLEIPVITKKLTFANPTRMSGVQQNVTAPVQKEAIDSEPDGNTHMDAEGGYGDNPDRLKHLHEMLAGRYDDDNNDEGEEHYEHHHEQVYHHDSQDDEHEFEDDHDYYWSDDLNSYSHAEEENGEYGEHVDRVEEGNDFSYDDNGRSYEYYCNSSN